MRTTDLVFLIFVLCAGTPMAIGLGFGLAVCIYEAITDWWVEWRHK